MALIGMRLRRKKHTRKKEHNALSKMNKYNIETEIENINNLKDVNPFTPPKPTDNLINIYENKLGFIFNDDYKQFIKLVGYSTYNGRDILDITGDAEDGRDLLAHINYAREIGIPYDWLPFSEDNGDYFCLLPNGKVKFVSHNGTSEEVWDNLASWIHEVWINGK
ncbi:SMI1/KNR4 family protein [Bartonella sp. HY329]|uniref:SMI1/KNR4 family protein n=1 Tax=unclassified Bartonella TaxID=2645622 RepID=UPI0021C6A55A|nr:MULTISPECIES: SMI1/KNR4 family protein [unclassified Bartonella]UXM94390.1 SMI1/KNR4 family protein [Bartonella sp. HY329]UXN08713.1 SMI1/KNR4 family protein [Bartonella sp. HY328]